MESPKPTCVSCPAKVLVAGGYLVLDRAYTGLVFGLDARIHTIVEPILTKAGVSISEIVVTSPQFKEAIWEYGYRSQENESGYSVTQLSVGHEQSISASKNPFIETALTYALTYIGSLLPNSRIASSSIRILADEAYYSNPGQLRPSSDASISEASRFLDFGVTLKEAHKTGLGSSAALVTSFTAAVLGFYLPREKWDIKTEEGLRVLHNLAQASHSYAQGKVGSGFDIASAVYGSCLYKRFSPNLLSRLPIPGSIGFAKQLKNLVEGDEWDTEIHKAAIQMPKGLRLVMCDVDCGSETPGMVKKVLKWREENSEKAAAMWDQLQHGNEALAEELTRIAKDDASSQDPKDKYSKLHQIIEENRAVIRIMSEVSGVPIEPPEQTKLLDYCTKIDGVIGGIVPGAGGYDAIVLLIEEDEGTMQQLVKALGAFKAEDSEEGMKIGKVGVIPVKQEMEGVRIEQLGLYKEWPVRS